MAESADRDREPRWSAMRRGLCCVLLSLAASGPSAAGALASDHAPDPARWAKRHHQFRGRGEEFWNNGPRFEHASVGAGQNVFQWRFTFGTSQDGSHVLHFQGVYSYYCGAGIRTLSDRSIPISMSGDFHAHGSAREYVNGRLQGTDYFSVIGAPAGHGDVVVSYMFEFVYRGQHLSRPYQQVYRPSEVACQSLILGTGKWR